MPCLRLRPEKPNDVTVRMFILLQNRERGVGRTSPARNVLKGQLVVDSRGGTLRPKPQITEKRLMSLVGNAFDEEYRKLERGT